MMIMRLLGTDTKRAAFKIVWALLAASALAAAQQVLTNDAIFKMVQGGLGEDLIVNVIQNQPGKYATTATDLLQLKHEGVSDRVLSAMLNKTPAQSLSGGTTQRREDIADQAQGRQTASPGATSGGTSHG